jgi:hypothetical protein
VPIYILKVKQGYTVKNGYIESMYGCETWSLTLREEHRLRVFDNRVLRRIFGPKRDEGTGGNGGSCTMRSFIICTHPQISLGKSSQGE